jgi:hypothetical protein
VSGLERPRFAALLAFETSLWHIPVSTIHRAVGDLTGCNIRRVMTARNIIRYVAVKRKARVTRVCLRQRVNARMIRMSGRISKSIEDLCDSPGSRGTLRHNDLALKFILIALQSAV